MLSAGLWCLGSIRRRMVEYYFPLLTVEVHHFMGNDWVGRRKRQSKLLTTRCRALYHILSVGSRYRVHVGGIFLLLNPPSINATIGSTRPGRKRHGKDHLTLEREL